MEITSFIKVKLHHSHFINTTHKHSKPIVMLQYKSENTLNIIFPS